MDKDKPKIIRQVMEGDEIIEYHAKKIPKPIGGVSHVLLPKGLLGKKVDVNYKKEDKQ